MTAFTYIDGRLMAERVAVADIARKIGTPFYCYSTAALTHAYDAFAVAFQNMPVTICFAVKANSNLSVIAHLAAMGAGADVVSGGELQRALAAGVAPERIVFSGVGKTRDEIAAALRTGVMQINVESAPELDVIAEVARSTGVAANVALRVNPDVDAKTHAKITTGREDNKFGIDMATARQVYGAAAAHPALTCVGIAVHIGSQLTGLDPFRQAFRRVASFVSTLREDGHTVSRIDLGGGLGVTYENETPPTIAAYADVIRDTVLPLGAEIVLEPGRVLVGHAGILVSAVEYVKRTAARRFVILDAAMNDLMRPALYDAYHTIVPVAEPADDDRPSPADIVGPVCETGDIFARDRALPEVTRGDLVAILQAGAYGAVMASNYNTRPRAAEVMVSGDAWAVVRDRETVADLMRGERAAPWIGGTSAAATKRGARS